VSGRRGPLVLLWSHAVQHAVGIIRVPGVAINKVTQVLEPELVPELAGRHLAVPELRRVHLAWELFMRADMLF
jgi:hypothetical protein